jgi:hypothetical protein
MDELRTLNKTHLKNMAIEKGLSRKGFNGRNISRMRKQDFIDFILDRQTRVSSDYDFEEEMLDFFGEIIMMGLDSGNIRIFTRHNDVSSSSSASTTKEQERIPKEEDECVPCLSLKKLCSDDGDVPEGDQNKIRSNILEMENKITCVICQSNERKILFSPCNHLATCIACSKNPLLKNCPLCRTEFDKLIRVFY